MILEENAGAEVRLFVIVRDAWRLEEKWEAVAMIGGERISRSEYFFVIASVRDRHWDFCF